MKASANSFQMHFEDAVGETVIMTIRQNSNGSVQITVSQFKGDAVIWQHDLKPEHLYEMAQDIESCTD